MEPESTVGGAGVRPHGGTRRHHAELDLSATTPCRWRERVRHGSMRGSEGRGGAVITGEGVFILSTSTTRPTRHHSSFPVGEAWNDIYEEAIYGGLIAEQ